MKPQKLSIFLTSLIFFFLSQITVGQFSPDYSQNFNTQVSYWDNYYDSLRVVYDNDTTLPDKLPGFSNYVRWKNYWKMYMPTSGDFAEAEQIFIMNDQYKTEIQMENAANTMNNINSITPQQWNELGPKNLSQIKTRDSQNNWITAHQGG